MIDFNPTAEQTMLREVAARFVRERHTLAEHRRLAATPDGFDRAHWERYAGLGWLGLALPEDVGGAACSFVEVAIVAEELGRGFGLEPYLSCAILCAHLLDRMPASDRRLHLLRDLVAGEALFSFAHIEAGTRFDHDRVADATARADGQAFVLDGAKLLALGGPTADHLIVSARTGSAPMTADGAFALFLVDPAAPGVSRSDYALLDGTRASDFRFSGVRLAADALLIGPDAAFDAVETAFDLAALACVAASLGCMETLAHASAAHLKTRHQFGKPLAAFQALQHRMAESFIEIQETRSALFHGLTSLDQAAGPRRAAVSAAKAQAGNAARLVGTQSIQLHGGIGMVDEVAAGHHYKKLVLLDKLFGDTDHHLDRFASAMGY